MPPSAEIQNTISLLLITTTFSFCLRAGPCSFKDDLCMSSHQCQRYNQAIRTEPDETSTYRLRATCLNHWPHSIITDNTMSSASLTHQDLVCLCIRSLEWKGCFCVRVRRKMDDCEWKAGQIETRSQLLDSAQGEQRKALTLNWTLFLKTAYRDLK